MLIWTFYANYVNYSIAYANYNWNTYNYIKKWVWIFKISFKWKYSIDAKLSKDEEAISSWNHNGKKTLNENMLRICCTIENNEAVTLQHYYITTLQHYYYF